MSLPITTTDKVGLHIANHRKSIELLHAAKVEDLPSRMGHASRLISSAIAISLVLLMRIASAVENVLKLLFLPFSKDENNKLNIVYYRLIRLGVLDPIHILTTALVGVIKTVSVFCGIYRPNIAQNGYILAETILLKFSQLKQIVREKLLIGIYCPVGTDLKKLESLYPAGAVAYLGQEKVKQCRDIKEAASLKEQQEKIFNEAADLSADVYAHIFFHKLAIKLENHAQDPLVFRQLKEYMKQPGIDLNSIKEHSLKVINPKLDGDLLEKNIFSMSAYDDLKTEKEQAERQKIDRIKVILNHMKGILQVFEKDYAQLEEDEKGVVEKLKQAIPVLQHSVDQYNAAIECLYSFGVVFVR